MILTKNVVIGPRCPWWALAAFRALIPLAIIFSIAWPEFAHFRTDPAHLDSEQISTLLTLPENAILGEISNMALAVSLGVDQSDRPRSARNILNGQLEAPAFSKSIVGLVGWPEDLQQSGLTFQLAMASLAPEELLLMEYEKSNNHDYYVAARDRILAFATWEAKQTQPIAFLWNDHAVAARISVLIRLWSHLRTDKKVTAEQYAPLLLLVAHSGELLAKDSQFTVRTNHGVMQNIALLQICAAFPSLPKAPKWRALAAKRLELQLSYYVSEEGVVLEHSAGYHILGTELLAYATRLIHLNGLEPSNRLLLASERASAFARLLLRPDASLPLFGNTAVGESNALVVAPNNGALPVRRLFAPFPTQEANAQLFPLSGYAVWWTGETHPSQTTIAWAKHDHHGHKHADEPSLFFWSRGFDWITAAGYWPYDQAGYAQANGWQGSNAPHMLGEASKSPRDVRLLASGEKDELRAIDIENLRNSGLRVRRQVIQLSPERLLVLDTVDGATLPIETLWTIDHRLTLKSADQKHFLSSVTDTGDVLHITLANPDNESVRTELLNGSKSPFAGWVVVGRNPTAASALRVEHNAPRGITATLISVSNSDELENLSISPDSNGEKWTVHINEPANPVTVERRDSMLNVISSGKRQSITLRNPPQLSTERQALRSAMSDAIELYPHWRDLGKFRQRLYVAIPILWAGSEIIIALLKSRRRWPRQANFGIIFAWAILGWWLFSVYLR